MVAEVTPVSSVQSFIAAVPRDLAGWVDCFDASALPVLRCTALAIEELRANEDSVDAHLLAETLSHDPLMTLKVMAHLAQLRHGRGGTDTETLTAALVMLGITPFFRNFGPQPTVEAHLEDFPDAIDGIRKVLTRSRRAAKFALAFAVQRMDHDAAILHDAALLHDFAELLMWLKVPELAAEVARRQRLNPALRSAAVQADVFRVRLPDLQHALMRKWHLPRLMIDIVDDRLEGVSTQARNVVLAIRLARHTAGDWENAAIADDVADIASLLNLGIEPTLALLHDIDDD